MLNTKKAFFSLYMHQRILELEKSYTLDRITTPILKRITESSVICLRDPFTLKKFHIKNLKQLDDTIEVPEIWDYNAKKEFICGLYFKDSNEIISSYLRAHGFALEFNDYTIEKQIQLGWIKIVS